MPKGDLKGDLVNGAYSLARISGLTSQPTPEDIELALERLEEMAAEFEEFRNIRTGYLFENEPDVNSPHGLKRSLRYAYKVQLAFRILSDFGKEPNQTLAAAIKATFSLLSSGTATVRRVQNPNRQPIGSGNRWLRYRNFYKPTGLAPNAATTNILFLDDIDIYQEDVSSSLRDLEDVASYVLTACEELEVTNDSLSTPIVTYTAKALRVGTPEVKIVFTTTEGRVFTRVINFEITEHECQT